MNISISGSLAEVTEILDRLSYTRLLDVNDEPKADDTTSAEEDPVLDAVEQSKALREKLEKDPNYNPYPGVSTPAIESAKVTTLGTERLYGADHDTGVEKAS